MFLAPLAGTPAESNIVEAIKWAVTQRGHAPSAGVIQEMISSRERAYTIGLALGYVMRKRKGNCGCKDLAYADHYLQARMMVGYLGPGAAPLVQTLVVGYEVKKKIWEELGLLKDMASDSNCPSPVSPDTASVRWGLAGVEDGKTDYYIDSAASAIEAWNLIFG